MQAFLAEPVVVDDLRARVEHRLDALVPAAADRTLRVNEAVRYSLLAPGKRIRPLLALLAAMQFGAEVVEALDVACATEMVHAASLILDDLPSMDDARLRRGQPTSHVRFGESTAILAAVALLNQAFATISQAAHLSSETRVALVRRLSGAVGFGGLVSGQDSDLNDRGGTATVARLETLNHQKTSVLFEAALEMGARVAGAGETRIGMLRQVATHLGLAFQIADDLYDGTAILTRSPKDLNKDRGKPTVVSLLGADRARERVGHHLAEALRLLPAPGQTGPVLRDYIAATFSQARLC